MSTALYRRYRPDTFADVIGQEHVTAPLVTALGKNSVSHAYLFSGPRGCGKTTSARILARCLNCEQGPTGDPCGECASCQDLSTGGSGSLDVIEIDAASHGGVDDARDLRERATFAPVRDRYKIFIIDEAHMVTAAGFNALLKIVEEPPEHIKFVFATTEPDKVIGTIRSRTHHYPFRLVPPEPLLEYLQRLCTEEQVPVDHGVLPLVIRAGGGSVRDTLSVLDQLIAGSEASGIDYDRAVALLGFTHASLLDDVVGAVAALDGATAFSVVDRVVQSGQDPRRFVEDLLERMRDLIIVKTMPDNPGAILRGVPDDQIRSMQQQAAAVGHAELSRAADITAQALTDMVGATSPRLHLELLMARLLLPQAESGVSSLASRLERMERRMDFASEAGMTPAAEPGAAEPGAAEAGAAAAGAAEAAPTPSATPEPSDDAASGATPPAQEPTAAAAESWGTAPSRPEPTPAAGAGSADEWATPGVPRAAEHTEEPPEEQAEEQAEEQTPAPAEPTTPQQPTAEPPEEPAATPAAEQAPEPQPTPQQEPQSAPERTPEPAPEQPAQESDSRVEMMRRAWPDIVQALAPQSRLLWMLIKDNASVAGFDGRTLTLQFINDGARSTFANRRGDQALNAAIQQVLGMQVSFDLITGGAPPAAGSSPKGPSRPTPASAPASDVSTSAAPAGAEPAAPAAEPKPSRTPQPAGAPGAAAQQQTAQEPSSPEPSPQEPSPQGPDVPEGAPAWVAEETPEPYDAEPEPPQAPPSPHPAWNGEPSRDPAGVADSPDEPDDEPVDPTAPLTAEAAPAPPEQPAPVAAQHREPPEDPAPSASSAPVEPPDQSGPSDQPDQSEEPVDAYRPSDEKPPIPVFARRAPASSSASASASTAGPGSPGASAGHPEAAPADQGAEQQSAGASGRIAAIKQRIAQRQDAPDDWNAAPPPPDPMDPQGPPPDDEQAAPAGHTPAGSAASPAGAPAPAEDVEEVPSDDDIPVEESSVFGRKALERLLDATLIEERRLDEGS
ncbi:hypothetical protein GCM10020260_22720 [Nesterenkonia halobia]|uniref:DNA-directed DNA polymerase n=1 Tax=Nesterenkonia halobia TaxID=37922 RepID=A0ABP6RGK3_9MICC